MERRENDSRAPGICQRLFNYFMSYLAFQQMKRDTLGGTNYKPSQRRGKPKEVSQDEEFIMLAPSTTIELEIHQGHTRGQGFSSGVEKMSSRQIVIEREKWRVEGGGVKKSVSMEVDDGRGERKEVRRGIPRREEVFDINELSEHFIQKRRAAMRAGTDVGPWTS